MDDIIDYCTKLGIISLTLPKSRYKGFRPSPEEVLDCAAELSDMLHSNLIIFGGMTAYPEMLGYRHLRKNSNDIDCLTNIDGIENLNKQFKGSKYFGIILQFGVLFLEYKGIPITFTTRNIHDLTVPEDLLSNPSEREYKGSKIRLCPGEYTIALKIRRAHQKQRFFGKDKSDIISLMVAPLFRDDLEELDLEKTAYLLHKYVTPEHKEVLNLIRKVPEAVEQLKEKERDVFNMIYDELRKSIDKQYD